MRGLSFYAKQQGDSLPKRAKANNAQIKEKRGHLIKKGIHGKGKGKIDEGQFEECNITLNEIEIIINSFINVIFMIKIVIIQEKHDTDKKLVI